MAIQRRRSNVAAMGSAKGKKCAIHILIDSIYKQYATTTFSSDICFLMFRDHSIVGIPGQYSSAVSIPREAGSTRQSSE
jgi:hypothetical protein